MEIASLKGLRLPIPLYATEILGSGISRDGAQFSVVAGLDEGLVAQLKKYSLDEDDSELQEHTSDKKRFGEGSYEEWYAKGRVPFALVNTKTGTLAALVWLGPKPLGAKSIKHLTAEEQKAEGARDAGEWHTISYRCYGPYRGKGLMTAFVRFTIDAYLSVHPGAKLWAISEAGNAASIALAEKLGFKPIETEDPHFVTTVRE